MTSFGLHVGNTNSCLAVHKDYAANVVANDAGSRVTPTSVCFSEDGEVLTGLSARQMLARFPKSGVRAGNKAAIGVMGIPDACEKLGQNFDVTSLGPKLMINSGAGSICYDVEKQKKLTPFVVNSHIVTNMHGIALSHSSSDSPDDLRTVLTVPAAFTPDQRAAVAKSADAAGFNVVQVISEPAAACLAYGLGQSDPEDRFYVVVLRIGGRGMDASLVLVNHGLISIVETVSRDNFGGDTITGILADYLAAEFERKYKADPRETKRGKQKLLTHAETVKHVLSTLDTANCYIESLYEGIDFNANVTRARFENELSKVVADMVAPLRELLKRAEIGTDSVEKLILSGGTSKIPKIQKAAAKVFDSAEVLSSVGPDEVTAYGAAIQAGAVTEKHSNPGGTSVAVKVMKSAISFIILDEENSEEAKPQTLIARHCPAPVRKSHHIEIAEGKQAVGVQMVAVGADGTCKELAKLSLSELSESGRRVFVSAHVHRDGGLHLALTEKTAGKCDQKDITLWTEK